MNNENRISSGVIEGLGKISSALERKDYMGALGVHVEMSTSYMEEASVWLIGIKRMIDLAKVMLP